MKVRDKMLKAAMKLAGGVFALALLLGIDVQAKDVTVNSVSDLQQVLDEARDLSETLNVTIPAGSDFTIERFLYIYPNTVINAQGAVIRNTNSSFSLIATPGDAAPANITINGGTWEAGGNSFIHYSGASNVAVNYATINGSGSNIAVLSNCQNVTFQDCVMSGASIQILGGKDNAVEGGSLKNTNSTGIPSILIKEAEGVTVNGVTISNSANTAIRLENSQKAQITGNPIENTYSIGIESVGGGNHNISNNYLKDSGYMGIRVATDQGSVIAGNGLDGNAVREGSNGEGLVVDVNSNGTVIRGNTVKNTRGVQNAVGNGIIVNRSTNITVSDNTVSDSANHGIQISYQSNKVTVSGNTISQSGRMGISVSRGAQADLKSNVINGSASRGITYDGKDGIVSGSIENCAVSGSKEQGIYIETANVSMSGNTLENSGTGGLAITNYSTVTADRNKIYQSAADNTYSGIAVTGGSKLTMNENIISNFYAVGVYGAAGTVVDGSNNQVNIPSGGFKDSGGAYSIASGMSSNTIYAYSIERTSARVETKLSGFPTGAVVGGKKIETTGGSNITVTYEDTDPAGVIVYTQDDKGNAICMQAPVNFNLRDLTVSVPDDVDVEEVRAFVSRIYTVALGRPAEEDGLNDWTNRLATGQKSGAEVAQGFFFSDEFKNKEMPDAQFVDTLYRTMFDREADQGGKEGWLTDLHNGVSREYVYRGFAQSDEFNNLCNRYNIRRGEVSLGQPRDQNPRLTEFVSRVYYIALNRNSLDEDGINDWCGRILGGANPSDVVWGIVFSDEFTNRKLSNEDFVKVMYRTYFDREADEDGFNDWMSQLSNGASREHVVNGFSGSTEFANLVQSFGL